MIKKVFVRFLLCAPLHVFVFPGKQQRLSERKRVTAGFRRVPERGFFPRHDRSPTKALYKGERWPTVRFFLVGVGEPREVGRLIPC